MQTTRETACDDLIYSINEQEKTASVISYKENVSNIFIPDSILINSEEYIVTSISSNAFRFCRAHNFAVSQFSQIQTIGTNSFFEAYFTTMDIPSSITSFDKYWNNGLYHLTYINVIKMEEENIKIIDNKYLVGKTDLNSDTFDVLLLAFRDIKESTIPSFIKIISSRAFQYCNDLKEIKLSPNSELHTICSYAFQCSSIVKIELPSNIQNLGNHWSTGSILENVKIIKKDIENIKIVRNKFLVGKSNPKSDIFDVLLFVKNGVKKAKIPAYIKQIAPSAFCDTYKVIFPKSSSLQTICKYAFYGSLIEKIKIPSQVEKIGKYSFSQCHRLRKFIFESNSKLKTIEKDAFYQSSIEYIEIPSNISCLNKGWCEEVSRIKKIKIIENGEINIKLIDNKFIVGKTDLKSDVFDVFHFAYRDIEEIKIPSYIKRIESNAFNECESLEKIEFEPNSQLQFIGDDAFSSTSIEQIDLPSNLIEIGDYSFSHCKLKHFNFSNDSMFEKFGSTIFFASKLDEICIPSNVKVINKFAFYHSTIKKITFQENSHLEVIEKGAISHSIEYLEIPSNVKELKKEWFNGGFLNKIKVIKNGQENIKFVNNFLVGKSDLRSDIFDVIYLASRNIRKAIIPAQIKKIASNAFTSCNDLVYIDFDSNSELQIIEQFAFDFIPIKSICIPPKVTEIKFYTFSKCENIEIIELSRSTFNASKKNLLFDINKAIFMVSN